MEDKKYDVELRSPRVKNIIGQIPPLIIRVGNGLFLVFFLLLFLIGFYLPLPRSFTTGVYVDWKHRVVLVPSENTGKLANSKEVWLSIAILDHTDHSLFPVRIISAKGRKVYNGKLCEVLEFDAEPELGFLDEHRFLPGELEIRKERKPFLRK